MNRRAFILTSTAALAAGPVFAAKPAAAPPFGVSANGAAASLEVQTAKFKQQMKAMGYGGADVFYELAGAASPTRFKTADDLAFSSTEPADIDPQLRFGLFRLTAVKNTRRLTTGKVNPLGYGTRNVKNQAAVAFTATRGDAGWTLAPAEPLAAGEYALAIAPKLGNNSWGWGGAGGGNQVVAAFGVD
ncbi:hypothetical protein GVN21_05615 [Caulobacter sp. SLTY]|uniref:hypothetical protein n=1 Tax=Caulobacter sp. SLTY TaxID=2683262 RepID=UPI001411E792|nr:hypothetical protein [Caulobacter sp. SLTY]NBB14840.1 hypothetical protein [Caulobacter sp. SLTY]